MPTDTSRPGRSGSVLAPLPFWLQRLVAYGVAAVVLSVVAWLLVRALLSVGLVAFALLAAVLLTALLAPLAGRLCRAGVPAAVAALTSIVLLIGVPAGIGVLVYNRVRAQLSDIGPAVTEGLDDIRDWLVSGPLGLEAAQIEEMSGTAVEGARDLLPDVVSGTVTVVQALTGVVLVIFTVFFLVKDGRAMWGWALRWVPRQRRERFDGGGRQVWATLTSYVRGTMLIALVDAVGIGAGLLLLGVPVWLSLALLTFLGAFVPIVGATVAGAVAVLVTLVTNGVTDAVIALVIVVAVQQLESNLLQPLIMGAVVRLHPLAVIAAVTCGTLLLGIAGAVLAVPVVAVGYRLVTYLSDHDEKVEHEDEEGPARDERADQEQPQGEQPQEEQPHGQEADEQRLPGGRGATAR